MAAFERAFLTTLSYRAKTLQFFTLRISWKLAALQKRLLARYMGGNLVFGCSSRPLMPCVQRLMFIVERSLRVVHVYIRGFTGELFIHDRNREERGKTSLKLKL